MKNFKIGKRILAGVFAVAMSGLVPLSIVSADDKSSEITYEKRTTYTINIPASISVVDTDPTNQQITISNPNISGEKELNVTVSSKFNGETNNLLLERTTDTGGGKSVTTAVTLSGPSIPQNVEVKNDTLVATFQDQGTAPTYGGTLNFGAITGSLTDNDNPIAAGTYTQPLTFKIVVEDRKH
ncbi:putative uncharacterized protein [Clostridium sp. CAG:557]|nr:putative uncharacterized protein [Clostridium sp. CAG:557]